MYVGGNRRWVPLTSIRGHKIWSRKNVHIIFVSVTSTRGKGTRFLGPEIWVRPLFRGLVSTQNVTDHKEG